MPSGLAYEVRPWMTAVSPRMRTSTSFASRPEIFTGAFWSGERAVALGLADRVGDLQTVVREKFGDKAEIKTIGGEKGFLRRRLGLASPARQPLTAESLAQTAIAAVEERLLWNRFGL